MDWHSYHNHSTWSDGQNGMEDMLLAARAAGIREYGFSDHFILTPWGEDIDWALSAADLPGYVDEVLALKKKYDSPDFTVRLGLEVDYFAERLPEIRRLLRALPFDYLIGACHFVGQFPIDTSIEYWRPLTQAQIDETYAAYWQKLLGAAESGLFTFLAHLDLPKKYKFASTRDFHDERRAVIQAAAANGIGTEVNTAGWRKLCAEQYPARDLLQECADAGLRVFLSADAHDTSVVTAGFPEGLALLASVGLEPAVL